MIMTNKMFNLTSTFKSQTTEDGSVMIRGMASTADFDRAGDTISGDAWTKGGLRNFEKNPIILFNHDYNRPIGRATGIKAGVFISPRDVLIIPARALFDFFCNINLYLVTLFL